MLICSQYVLPVTSEPIMKGAVLVRDDRIADIGTAEMLKLRYPDEDVIDYGLAAVMPGLVDLDTRLEYAVMRGVVSDLPFAQWFLAVADHARKLEPSDWFDSAILGGLDALSSGITTIADITATGAARAAAQRLGLRGVIYHEVSAVDKDRIDNAMRAAADGIEAWRQESDGDRITIGIAPAAAYRNHPAVYGRVSEYASEHDLPVALRLAGSREEVNFVKYGSSMFAIHAKNGTLRSYTEVPPWLPTGVTPVRYVLNWGAFEAPNVMIIHAVHVTDEDVAKLREHDVAVCLTPRSSAQLGMGTAPLDEFLRAGLRVGLGTDSPAATNSTDILTEMRSTLLLQRATNARRFLSSTTMLELATIGGARALGMEESIGSLEIGKQADIIAVDLSSSHHSVETNPVSALVNTCTATDVLMTMVDGVVLYEKNNWHVNVEVAKNIARVIEIRSKLRN